MCAGLTGNPAHAEIPEIQSRACNPALAAELIPHTWIWSRALWFGPGAQIPFTIHFQTRNGSRASPATGFMFGLWISFYLSLTNQLRVVFSMSTLARGWQKIGRSCIVKLWDSGSKNNKSGKKIGIFPVPRTWFQIPRMPPGSKSSPAHAIPRTPKP